MVGLLPSGQPQEGYLATAEAHVGHKTVHPYAQQCAAMEGWRSRRFSVRPYTRLYPALLVRRIHELGHKLGRMAQRNGLSGVVGGNQDRSRLVSQ